MFIDIDKEGSLEGFQYLIDRSINSGAKAIMLLSCDKNALDPEQVNLILSNVEIPVFGGIFPEIIYNDEKLSIGTALLGFDNEVPYIHIVRDISNSETDIEYEISTIEEHDFKTMFVYVDAFSTQIDKVISELYYEFGVDNNFIGGGAGSISFVQKPVLFSNEGLLEDALILATIKQDCSIGVKHGWKSIEGPFQITDSNKNIINELDYQPAFDVYKKVVEKSSGKTFTDENFFDISKAYPFGISKLGTEKIVRDPIAKKNNSIICVGDVKQGSYVDILNGQKQDLIDAAKEAYAIAKKGQTDSKSLTFFVDCISRVLFLEDDFEKELRAIADNNTPTIGALTLGEIANTGRNYLKFYNKTSVVAVF